MELERPRKMELLHTPKTELVRLMRENTLTVDEVVFLFGSNKLAVADIRMNAPSICDKLLNVFLHQNTAVAVKNEKAAAMPPVTA